MAVNYTTSFNINVDDLQYILKQIKIAEATSIGYSAAPLSMVDSIIATYGGDANSAALLPAGLRTVDGTFNNLRIAPTGTPGTPGYNPGTSTVGAADTLFPRLTDPVFQTVNGPGIDFNGDGIIDVINHNYGDTNGAAPGGIRSVADADPRTISNLISDMSVNNPAAIAAYLGNPLSLEQFAADHAGTTPVAPADIDTPLKLADWLAAHPGQTPLAITNTDLATIPNQSPDIGLSPGFNSWMTFFGQFFDHGLDLVTKGSNGTVYIPLAADDVLYDKGADGIANNVVDAFFVSDPALAPAGAPLPAVSGVPSAWQAFYVTDPANRALYAPGAFAPVITATPTAFAVKFNDDGAGADGLFSTGDDRPNFMALTRATVTFDANGVPQAQNTTTPWIDQNQTYTSNSSHQVFLREYAMTATGAVSTGRLLDGTAASGSTVGAIGNWSEVKTQAIEMLGLKLSDHDVNNVPLLLTDQYGKFIPGANGFARVTVQVQVVNDATGRVVGTQGSPFFMDGVAGGLDLANLAVPSSGLPALAAGLHYQTVTVGTNHAFLNDIAHHAAPGFVDLNHDGFKETKQTADADIDANHNGVYDAGIDTLTDVNGDGAITTADFFAADKNADGSLNESTYDDEMLASHFITGDGRGNENIGLTTVHSIFHSEHNRAVEANQATILAAAADTALNSADHALAVTFLNEWLLIDVAPDSTPADIALLTPADLTWDGERLFQAGRFSTEMQYQHLVFEEFARRIQPAVDPFIFTNSAALDPSIVAEFAHTVYRFGHSMLTGTVDRLDVNLNPLATAVSDPTSINGQQTLLAVFLNPQAYTAGGVDAATINADLIRGLSRDVGNALDEFIVTDVRSNLLGLPLDLGALNIARGRETGIPSLNQTRAQIYASSGLADLKPYANWAEYAAAITNPASIINFIAAYGNHASLLSQTTMAGMRDAAAKLVLGDSSLGGQAAIDFENDRLDFLNHTGVYATDTHLGGMNDIDLWIGGLAEAHPEFGGMLGTTFNYVFEYQLESLQNGDRMYYLSRTQGLNFLNQLEPNTFADLVMRNTELGDIYSTHLNGFLFVTPDHFLELDRGIAQEDYNGVTPGIDPLFAAGEAHGLLTPLKVMRSYTGATTTVDPLTGITHDVGGTLRFTGGEHVVVGGTEGNDKIWTDKGIDTLWGDGGDDYLNAGTESDNVFGGAGDDIIEDPFGDELLRGNQGNDVITSARGVDIFFGDQGQDYIMVGQDAGEVFAGQDNDFVLGGSGTDGLMGNEGDDWIEGGEGLDGISGENSQLFFNSTIIGHDVLNGQGNDTDYDGESGDDIMVQTVGITRSNGMFGFDWGIHKNDSSAANSDLGIPIFATQLPFTLRDRFDSVEGLSGWNKDDTLTGAAIARGGAAGFGAGPGNPVDESDLKAKNVGLIDGLKDLLGLTQAQLDVLIAQELAEEAIAPTSLTAARSSSVISIAQGAEIIIGGGGSDTIQGNLGNDILDGDAWLNVRIKIVVPTGPNAGTYSAESMNTSTLISGPNAGKVFNTFADGTPNFASPAFGGASLNSLMLNRTLNPGQLSIVREILHSNSATDIDTAVYRGAFNEYTVTLNDDNSLTIAHTNPTAAGGALAIDDGTDTIRNFEMLQFSDVAVSTTEFLNRAPVITSNLGGATAAIGVAENTPASTLVTTVTATDGNNVVGNPLNPQTLTFSISGGADAALFAINATTGVLRLVASPNFEAPTDAGGNNVYDVIVQVSDGIAVDTQAIAVTVTNVNEAPVITSAAIVSVAENTTVAATVTATDPDNTPVPTQTLSYSITGGADAALFAIDATTGVLSFVASPNFELPTDADGNNVYDVVVQVSDGALTNSQTLAVTVTNVNEAPVITSNGGLATADIHIAENGTAVTTVTATDPDAGTTLTYTIGGVDATNFLINAATGELVFNPAPDFEGAHGNIYNVTVTASDGTLSDSQAITVTVTNVNEAPVITSATAISVAENSTAVGTVTATDVDAGTILSYSITGGADAALFAIDATTGVLSFVASPNFELPTDAGGNNVYDVIVQVTDGTLTDTKAMAVTVTNVNEAPVITSVAAFNVVENSTAVGTVTATDVDAGTSFTYTIAGGADAALFNLDAATGALSFKNAPDFEGAHGNTYNVTVTASDGSLSDTQALTVTVANVNEAPVITSNLGGATAAVSVAENSTAVTTVTAADPDAGANVTYSIVGGDDDLKFSINAVSGVLSFIAPPNFEIPTDAGGNNVYDVIVQASDGLGGTDTQAIAVTVTDVIENHAPVITSNGGGDAAAIAIAENTNAVTIVTAIDIDAGTTLAYSIVSGADAGLFAIDAGTGVLSFVTAPNFEAPRSNVYNVTVQVSDGIAIDTQVLAVTVSNVNEAATGSASISGASVTNTSASYTASNNIVDPDGGGAVTYQWQRFNGAAWVDIAGATSATLAGEISSTVRVTASITDVLGTTTAFTSAETAITGRGTGPGALRNNTLTGTTGNDIMAGLFGNDTLNGGAGTDTAVFGTALAAAAFNLNGAGNLTVNTGAGDTDTLNSVEKAQFTDGTFSLNIGTNAADTLVATTAPELFLGFAGSDTVSFASAASGINANLTTGVTTAGDRFFSIANLTGSASADNLTGDGNGNVLTGGAGNDVLNGAGGSDTAAFSGALANYGFTVDGSGNLVVTDNRGGSPDGADTLISIENLQFGAQSLGLAFGNNADNTVNGSAGNDLVLGLGGNDTLAGGTGADLLVGGAGADTFDFNALNESGIGAAARDLIADFVSGIDKLDFSTIDARTGFGAGNAGNNAFVFNDVEGAAITGRGQLVYHYEGSGATAITVVEGNVNANLGADFQVALTGHVVFNQATDLVL